MQKGRQGTEWNLTYEMTHFCINQATAGIKHALNDVWISD